MPTIFSDVVQKPTINQQYQQFTKIAQNLGIPMTRVGSTSLLNLLIQGTLRGSDYLWYILSLMASNLTNIFNAQGIWLDLLANGFYDLQRFQKVPSIGSLYINILQAGVQSVILTDTSTGVQYTGKWDGTLPASNPVSIQFTAQSPGEVGNVAGSDFTSSTASSNSPTLYTVDSLNNPSDYSWISSFGTEIETDDQLRTRCLAVIANTAIGSISDNIITYILNQTGGGASRIAIENIVNSNNRIIYVAGSSGVVQSSLLGPSGVLQILGQNFSGPETNVTVQSAGVYKLIVGGSILFKKGTSLAQKETYRIALTNYLNTRPIMDPIKFSTSVTHIYDIYEFLNAFNGLGVMIYPNLTFQNSQGFYVFNGDIELALPFSNYQIYQADCSQIQLVDAPTT